MHADNDVKQLYVHILQILLTTDSGCNHRCHTRRLRHNEICAGWLIADDPQFNPSSLRQYIRQEPNAKWFSLVKLPLGVYSMAGRDSSRWINRTLWNIGEPPVLYDTLKAQQTVTDLRQALLNRGYMQATVEHHTEVKDRKLTSTCCTRADSSTSGR